MMQQISIQEVEAAFAGAKNLNAALKNFLKRETQGDKQIERFAKDFRAAAADGETGAFLARAFPKFENYLSVIVRYAYAEQFAQIIQKVVERYADEFNATYTASGDSITLKDRSRFTAIAQEVEGIIGQDLQAAGAPANGFMKRAAMQAIFDPEVYTEVVSALN